MTLRNLKEFPVFLGGSVIGGSRAKTFGPKGHLGLFKPILSISVKSETRPKFQSSRNHATINLRMCFRVERFEVFVIVILFAYGFLYKI